MGKERLTLRLVLVFSHRKFRREIRDVELSNLGVAVWPIGRVGLGQKAISQLSLPAQP